jgi:hypothetical protein
MRIPTIKELMHEQARFVKYQDGKLWYQLTYCYEENKTSEFGNVYRTQLPAIFDFPIDVRGEDAGGEFGSSEKAITLMRWIRKHIELLAKAQAGDI